MNEPDLYLHPEELDKILREVYEEVRPTSGGHNADYIPYLANVDPDLFGISLCLVNGHQLHIGDTDFEFGIESISKVHTAVLAMDQNGPDEILNKIGADATGLPFNSVLAILLENERPSTPLVNAGAIAACSMVKPIGDLEAKWLNIIDNVGALNGREPRIIDELYASEFKTNYNNRSIAWLLKDYDRIYDDPDMSLELYTRQCSLGVTAHDLAIAAATIANDGLNPITKKQVFDGSLTPKIVSLITTVGFYQRTGDWLYESGIPAKSGVGGGILGVMPGLFGICAFSPPLDDSGNSVKGQRAVHRFMEKLGLNIFDRSRLCIIADDEEC
ncbi:MAG: glutaminase A [Eggerthellaceae bacterium]|nr:glutaminase A [Eggerthellaceae bacterium]